MKVAVIGGGWAGMAAAVAAIQAGHRPTVLEAAPQLGGRARALPVRGPDGGALRLDNGQHILAGAYRETLRLMRSVGVAPKDALLRMPLTLRFPDGGGLALPPWPAPVDAAAGIAMARGWSAADKWSLARTAWQWRAAGFECGAAASVADLCHGLTPNVLAELVEPLCVSALNTPAARASGQVFLRVMRDTLFEPAGSNLLLPRTDLGSLFPEAAARWLAGRGGEVATGQRVRELAPRSRGWRVDGRDFDAVLLACPPQEAARLAEGSGAAAPSWPALARGLQHEAIATVYTSGGPRLPLPMLALRTGPQGPAQFVFDRSRLGGPPGLLAFVVSACTSDREQAEHEVVRQAHALGWTAVRPLQTVVEKRATFACTPGLQRPPQQVAPGLLACGDYVEGPYPATLEGAVRSALQAVAALAPAGTVT
ncbi:NAD(P)-binding protein [Ramlibacter sp. RBP-2]|uniref:NAD(P)-binding protein n=1 Tax=Ramlibacter lithotrophicus TaxID=2606681 RepID=A0A7X6I673_9BURK|nr:hydroxysqualene dehydroxylase HpnE [Ramlibacter lithotrophicus]NKE65814.1 NAD(P)-binding protein [Ramlibacter lithotrophicus]